MDLYAQNILDRYKEPYYKDKAVKANAENEEVNHSCGDRLNSKLEVLNSKIKGYTFSGEGCAISQAAADILGDLLIGKTVDEVLAMTKEELFEALGIEISLRRSKCALLGLISVKNALLKYLGKEPDSHLTIDY